jgi:hypothetical protein
MKIGSAAAFLLLSCAAASAHELPDAPVPHVATDSELGQMPHPAAHVGPFYDRHPERCNAHRRKWKNPATWLEENMCDADCAAWLAAHPYPKNPLKAGRRFWPAILILGANVGAEAYSTSRGAGAGIPDHFLGGHYTNGDIAAASSLKVRNFLRPAVSRLSRRAPGSESVVADRRGRVRARGGNHGGEHPDGEKESGGKRCAIRKSGWE